MKTSRLISIILIIMIIGIIAGATSLKVYNNHKQALLRVSRQKIEEAAQKCNIDNTCENEVTLGFLIEKGYLDNQVHPLTKEFIDTSLVVTCKNYNCETILK